MKTYFAFVPLLVLFHLASAQFPDSTLVQHSFHSKAFDKERKITVHLPSRYVDRPDEAMMVTYVLDAQGPQYFNMLIANLDYLTSRYSIMPTLVVGIHSDNRFAEFTPFAREGNTTEWEKNLESKLPNLYQHLEKEVFPWVEANFRTKPFRAIIGHSRGGSFIVQSLFDGHKDLFDAFVSISPALHFDNYQSIDLAEKLLKQGETMNKFFFCSSGDVGETEIFFNKHVNRLDSVLKENPSPSLTYHRAFFAGKDHFSTVMPALTEAMVRMKNQYMVSEDNIYGYLKNKDVPISQQIEAFIAGRKAKKLYYHDPGKQYYVSLANELKEIEDYTNALDLYLFAEKLGDFENWWEYLNVGLCMSHTGQKDRAKGYFDKTLIKIEDWREQYADKYDEIVKDVKEQMEDALKK